MTFATPTTVHRPRAAGRLPGASLLLAWPAIPAFFLPGLDARLEYERAAVAAGEVWRLVTGHWTHWSLDHLVWDGLAFLALAAACELRDRKRFALCLAGAALVVPLGVFWLQPGLDLYRGLSGLDSALFALLAVLVWRQEGAGPRRWLVLGGAALFAAKVAWEAVLGEPLFVEPGATGFAVVPLAHLLGAAVGAAAGLPSRVAAHRDGTLITEGGRQ